MPLTTKNSDREIRIQLQTKMQATTHTAQKAEVWAIDILGWGFTQRNSNVVKDFGPEGKREHLRAFIEQYVGKGRKVILVGASLGGSVAIDMVRVRNLSTPHICTLSNLRICTVFNSDICTCMYVCAYVLCDSEHTIHTYVCIDIHTDGNIRTLCTCIGI
jgi:hypothetical protein